MAEATGEPRLSGRAIGFGIPAWRVDGMDPLAVHLAMVRALSRLRAGEGPVVIEALVYRFFHQNGPFPGSAFGYRTKEEEAAWRARDPLDRVGSEMTRLGLIDALDQRLELLKIHLPYHESDHVLGLAYLPLCGGTCLQDLELLRHDEVLLDALDARRLPDPTTAGDFCRRFSEADVEQLMTSSTGPGSGPGRSSPPSSSTRPSSTPTARSPPATAGSAVCWP